nr:type II toxin-antitoxin system HicA family toxin [Paraburkholderia bannensis]
MTLPRSVISVCACIVMPFFDIIFCMKTKHARTLAAIFTKPTLSGVVFTDIEALVKSLGGEVIEREGSRVKILLNGQEWRCHRPHPGKEARRYQVEEAREFFEQAGVKP